MMPRPLTAADESVRKRLISLSVNGRRHDVWVTPSELLLDVLHDELGLPEVRYGCGEGVCGTCETKVLEGVPDHRDMFMTDEEHARNDQFTPCCSRAKSELLVLDL